MKKYFIIILALFLVSCERYFIPDIDSQESSLIFEGLITDQPSAQFVKILKSISYNEDSSYQYVPGFNVVIEDEFGSKIQLYETSKGIYSSDTTEKGIVGNKYRMLAISPEGKTYISSWELLEPAAPIDTIYGEYAEEAILRYNEQTGYVEERIPGINILNNAKANGYSSFYRYEFSLVYETINTYPTTPFPTVVYVARPVESKYHDFISTVNANLYSNTEIIGNKALFVSEESMHLRVTLDSLEYDTLGEPLYDETEIRFQQSGFLVELHQYSLSESGFGFWDAVNKQSNSSGQIFDPVDTQIKGNISNMADSTELVFGYFGASAITKKAMYLYLSSSETVKVKSAIYFPFIRGPRASYKQFDFWVY